ncbi:MAG TPA: hypothetical protein VGP93_02765, partial [Polyangiaceae bacterium]|nr:hypothetical protein [Polyangiaceae bacterium]
MRAFRRLLVALVLTAFGPCPSALAQPSAASVSAAEALFDQGRQAVSAGDYETACSRFRESNRLDPAVGTRLNLADCEEKRGKLAVAWSLFRGAVAELDASDDRLPVVKQRVQALEARVPKLVLSPVKGAPSDLRATVAGAELSSGSFGVALPLDPGHFDVLVTAPNSASRTYTIDLAEGETAELDITAGEAVPPPEEKPAPPAEQPSAGQHRTLTYVLGGVGAAGLVVGTVAGIVTLNKKS